MSTEQLHNELQLLSRVSEGDEAAFESIYRFYRAQLKPIIWKYADSGLEAEEIMQETFLKVWINRDKLPDIENFRAWLFTIASREYLNAIRKKVHYAKRLDHYAARTVDKQSPESPYDALRLEEVKRCIADAVSKLSPQRKAIYDMRRQQGLSLDEIAQQLGISVQTVKNVLLLVTRLIREHLEAAGHGPFIIALSFLHFF